MKLIVALVAVVLAAASVEAAPISDPWQQQGWQDPWQQQSAWQQPSAWQNPWQSSQSGWQDPWKQSQGWQPTVQKGHHEPHYVHAIQVPQPPSIPPLHPEPLHLKVHDHPNRIHYKDAHPGHPHLIGVEAHVHEPEIKVVKHGW